MNSTVVTLTNKTDVTLKDLTIGYSRDSAVVVSDCKQITLQNLTIHSVGGNAVNVGGEQIELVGSSIKHAGCVQRGPM